MPRCRYRGFPAQVTEVQPYKGLVTMRPDVSIMNLYAVQDVAGAEAVRDTLLRRTWTVQWDEHRARWLNIAPEAVSNMTRRQAKADS